MLVARCSLLTIGGAIIKTILFTVFSTAVFVTLLYGQGQTQTKPSGPAEVVKEFYTFHFANDMGFTEETVKKREAWLAPEMQQAIHEYFALEQDPNEPPYINGDPFTGTQEYPNSFKVGEAKIVDNTAQVNVVFEWKEPGVPSRKADVLLKKTQDAWRIDDIQFADQESMRKLLAEAKDAE